MLCSDVNPRYFTEVRHHADGGRQADKAEAHIGEQGCEVNKGGDKFKHPGCLDAGGNGGGAVAV